MWNTYLRDNINKLLDRGHRVLTVAQFSALTGLEGTKGTVAPDEVYLEVDATSGIEWHFAYESGEVTYKWRFVGGPPLYSRVETAQATASGSPVDLGGPSITLPRGGDYDVAYGAGANTNGPGGLLAFFVGGAEYSFSRLEGAGGGGTYEAQSSEGRITGRGAGDVEKLMYGVTGGGGTLTYRGRYLTVTPVRVRHDG